jgi:hypothetical protein
MKDNLTMLGANNDKPTPEEWVAHHERLHNKHLQRQQQVDLAVDYVTNEEIRGNEMTYPYIFIDTGTESETYLHYCIRVSDTLSYDGYKTMREALQAMDELGGER